MEDIQRYLGKKKGVTEITPNIKNILENMIKLGKAMAKPIGSYSIMKIMKKGDEIIELEQFSLTGKRISAVLKNSLYVILLATTIGGVLEEEIEKLEKRKKFTEALILDAVGSTMADQAMDFLQSTIQGEFHRRGFSFTMRYSPGYGDLPLKVQPDLVKFSGGEEIGIKVTKSYMMIPKKSVTAIIGLEK